MARRAALLWSVCLAVTLCQAAYARSTPAKAYVSSSGGWRTKPASKQFSSWSIGDILVASHNAVGFPRIDVLDPTDLSVKDTVDLVPACGGQSKTHGMSFSPRFSTMKLQLAVSCASDQSETSDGKVVMIAAKQAQHPVVQTVPLEFPGASVYSRGNTLYVFGKQQRPAAVSKPQDAKPAAAAGAAAAVPTAEAKHADAQPALVANATSTKLQSLNSTAAPQQQATLKNSTNSSSAAAAVGVAATAAAAKPAARPARTNTPTVLYKLESATTKPGQQPAHTTGAAAAVDTQPLHVATVMPSWIPSPEDLAMDMGPKGLQLYYTLGKNMLRTLDTATGLHLPDRQLPAGQCSAVLAQYDGTILVACGKCLYHLPASASDPPLKQQCLSLTASFGRFMALDPTGTHVLISTVDGGLHSVQLSDLKVVKQTVLPGRVVGGVAVLGTVLANQQDCTPGTGCCPYGRLLSRGTTCRKATTECLEEAQCDGVSAMCPENPMKTLGTICRHPRKPCEQPATCDGVTNVCPPSVVMANGTRCVNGAPGNVCAAAGECDGVTGACHVSDRKQANSHTCAWSPGEAFNVFKKASRAAAAADAAVHIAAVSKQLTPVVKQLTPQLQKQLTPVVKQLTPKIQKFAVGALRNWARRAGRTTLAVDSVDNAVNPLAVCEGVCRDSKCVMSVHSKGCCILPGSRLADELVETGDKEQAEDAAGGKEAGKRAQRRGTEEDLYCWE